MRKSFVVYESFLPVLKTLSADKVGKFFIALSDYALADIEPNFGDDQLLAGLFAMVRPQIDATNSRFDKSVENGNKGREAGKLGGRPRKELNPLSGFDKQDNSESDKNPLRGLVGKPLKHSISTLNSNSKKVCSDKEFEGECLEILTHFNKVRGGSKRSVADFANNLHFWLYETKPNYSLVDIKNAIECICFDDYWCKARMPLQVLLRRRNPKGEEVDYIGEMLGYLPKLEREKQATQQARKIKRPEPIKPATPAELAQMRAAMPAFIRNRFSMEAS